MSLSTLSIKRPVFTIVINLLIILFGILGFSYLGVREFPSIDPAVINVRTNYTGANADIIESQIGIRPVWGGEKVAPFWERGR